MLLRLILCALSFSAALLFSGCAHSKQKPKEKPVVAAPPPVFVGTIALVNREDGFVLIDNGLLSTPPDGLLLKSFQNGAESGELLTSPVKKRPFVIADIKGGAPQKGDRVFVARGNALPASAVSPTPAAPSQSAPPPEFLPPVQLAPTP